MALATLYGLCIKCADAYSLEALRLAERYYKRTDGYFNVAIGSITKELYHFGEDECLPDAEALKRSDVNISALHIKNGIATIAKDMKIDLGGMGKGFCVDKVSAYLRKKNHLINPKQKHLQRKFVFITLISKC